MLEPGYRGCQVCNEDQREPLLADNAPRHEGLLLFDSPVTEPLKTDQLNTDHLKPRRRTPFMFNLEKIQAALVEFDFDCWLLYDFRGSNVLATRVLNIAEDAMGSRRFLYAIPKSGTPIKLVHRIEQGALDHLPGEKKVYLEWQEFGRDEVLTPKSVFGPAPKLGAIDQGGHDDGCVDNERHRRSASR